MASAARRRGDLVFLCRHDRSQLIKFLERLRRQHLRRLAGAQSRAPAVRGGEAIDDALLADLSGAALRFREEAELRWIDHCLLRLRPLIDEAAAEVGTPSGERERDTKPGRERS